MSNKNEDKRPCVIRARKEEVECIFALFAALQEFSRAQTVMNQRLHAIQTGWRDIRLLHAVLSRTMDALVMTLPYEKLVSIRRLIPNMRFNVRMYGTIGKQEDGDVVLKDSDMYVLCRAAHDRCLLCDEDCNRCELGKTFDRVIMQDRPKDGSWSFEEV